LFTVPDICGFVKNFTYLVTELIFENCIKIYTIRGVNLSLQANTMPENPSYSHST